nr:lysylphosphatidylglycerol synthase transmembrane domain-containing protein [Streptomyces sporangiiformans]
MSAQAVAVDAQPRAVRADVTALTVRDGATARAVRDGVTARTVQNGGNEQEIRGRGVRLALRTVRSRVDSRALRTHLGTFVGVAILGVLLWRLGTGVFLDGLRRIDGATLLVALGIGVVTTVFSAWRWCLVARGLKIRLPLRPAVADYYRALFLNAALPGGVLGDVHRAVRHGQSAGDLGRGVRAVVLERVAGQVALIAFGGVALLTLPSPVQAQTRHLAEASAMALAVAGVVGAVVAIRLRGGSGAGSAAVSWGSSGSSRWARALRTALTEAREGLVARHNWPGVVVSSAVVLAGHLLMFVVSARVAGSDASAAELVPLAVLALLAMGLPLNVGGWGPREGVTAWAFGAAGLGATTGLTVAVVYGVLSLVASLPGGCVLVARWAAGMRRPRPMDEKGVPEGDDGHFPRSPLAADQGRPRSAPSGSTAFAGASAVSGVRIEKYEAKQSTRPASSSFPFSAEASEGRPMTPESV